MNLGIADALNAHYYRDASKEAENAGRWRPRPSALGGCLREAAHLLHGDVVVTPRSPESMRVLELGHQRGRELARRLKESLVEEVVICDCNSESWQCLPTCSTRVAIPVPWGEMHGNFDVWIPARRLLVDFKTAGVFSLGLILAGEKQDEGYALQLNAYRHGLWAKDGPRAENFEIRTVLVYEAKDSDPRKGVQAGMLVEQEIPYSAELEQRYSQRLDELHKIILAHGDGTLDPLTVPGMPKDAKGNPHWRCRMKEGVPQYCSIGPIVGQCS